MEHLFVILTPFLEDPMFLCCFLFLACRKLNSHTPTTFASIVLMGLAAAAAARFAPTVPSILATHAPTLAARLFADAAADADADATNSVDVANAPSIPLFEAVPPPPIPPPATTTDTASATVAAAEQVTRLVRAAAAAFA